MTTLSASRNVGNLGMMLIFAMTLTVLPITLLAHVL